MARQDLCGMRFGRLTVIEYAGESKWKCRCDCGKECNVDASHLKSGHTRSCGCLSRDVSREANTTHGMSDHPAMSTFKTMKTRCYNPHCISYPRYGGRGIGICDEWLADPGAFIRWAEANGWRKGLTIDRIDNDKGYSPDNCRVATYKTQANNTRRTRIITYNGETKSMKEWCEQLGLNYWTIRTRLDVGMDPADALNKPTRYDKIMITYNGVTQCRRAWCRELNISEHMLGRLLDEGYSIEEIANRDLPPEALTRFRIAETKRLYAEHPELRPPKPGRGRKLEYEGEVRTIKQWCTEWDVPYSEFRHRFYSGWTLDEIKNRKRNRRSKK